MSFSIPAERLTAEYDLLKAMSLEHDVDMKTIMETRKENMDA